MFRWDGVPGFGSPMVQEVDTVQVHVFGMPGKRRLPHAKVQVCRVNACNLHTVILVHHVQDGAQALNIP